MSGGSDPDEWAAVEARLSRLDAPDLAALVADLWAARGFDTERTGASITVTRGTEDVSIVVGTGGLDSSADRNPDIIVSRSSGTHEGTTVLDATDLTERLRYAVEPETSRALCERHLGAVPGDLSVPSSARVRRRLSPAVLSVALLSLVGAVLVAAALGALGGPAGEASSGAETVTPAGPPQPSPIGQGVTADGVNTAEAQVDVDAGQLPPGVATAGLSDLDVLARAHASALGNRSYTIRLTRTRPEIRDREVTQVRREVRLRVEGDRYLAESVEVVDGQRRRLATLYHDGSETYLASVREGSYERVEYPSTVEHFPPAPGNLSDRVVRARLADSTTTLAGTAERHGERLYRVDAERHQAALEGSALISHESVAMVRSDGLVRAFRTNYSYLGGDTVVDARRKLVYDRIGETTVDPPDWYREEFGGEA